MSTNGSSFTTEIRNLVRNAIPSDLGIDDEKMNTGSANSFVQEIAKALAEDIDV